MVGCGVFAISGVRTYVIKEHVEYSGTREGHG